MRKLLLFLLLPVAGWCQTMTHAFWILQNYTNATEATQASTLSGAPAYSSIIFNTDLSKIRYWNGSAFADAPPIVTSALPTITNSQLAGSIDLSTKVTGVLPFASNAGTSAATSATTGTMTVSMTTRVVTVTPTAACTFNATGGVTGQTVTFVVTTSGVSSFVLTWGTNYKTTATLATGTTSGKIFTVSFLCTNGTQWVEIARTTAQ